MYELQSLQELRELYDEWFSNKDYWFSKNSKIDVYLCDKYYKYIEITENIYENYKNNLCHYEDKIIIACIILLDQISRHFKRVYDTNIDIVEFSRKAINFSNILLLHDGCRDNRFTIDELSFIYLPYRHLKDIDKIYEIIGIYIELYEKADAEADAEDKLKCRRYLQATLNNIYKDIKGDYSADVRYGMLAGLNPAQGLIFMLQALGGKLISKDMAMRELPFGINVTQEQEKIEIEDMRTALIASMQAYSQAIPQMAVQGQDPTTIVKKIAEVIKARQKGVTLEDAIEDIFAPELPPAGAEQMVEQTSPAPEASPGGPIPVPAQGQQGAPDIQSLLSSLSASGKGTASARRVIRR